MERWVLVQKGGKFQEIGEKYKIHPRIAALIRNRDIEEKDIKTYLYGGVEGLHSGERMFGMGEIVSVLKKEIERGNRIRVIGDYDIDGVNATYILLKGLEYVGAVVDSDIPDRMKDGYGLSKELIWRAKEDGATTILTCDNGIAAKEEVEYGRSLGLTMLITDHHDIPMKEENGKKVEDLPNAHGILNPKQKKDTYPFSGLCGAAVAYKLVEVLCREMKKEETGIQYLLENVGIATIGDVMELKGENRIFAKLGLEKLRQTKNLGLSALLTQLNVDRSAIRAYTVGFLIGPCINAGGRLSTAKKALDLLLVEEEIEAERLAKELISLNEQRKEMTQKALEEGICQVENRESLGRVLVVYLPDCHESLAGIVAGRLREKYHRPTFVLTKAEEGLKGSGRSIEGYSMREKLEECSQFLGKFGGHPMAAGLSMKEEDLELFAHALEERCGLSKEMLLEKVRIDMELPFSVLSETFLKELGVLEPFGCGNPKPLFGLRKVKLRRARLLGKHQNVLKMDLVDSSGTFVEGLCFGKVEKFLDEIEGVYGKEEREKVFQNREGGIYLNIAYYPELNEFRGVKTVQVILSHFQVILK